MRTADRERQGRIRIPNLILLIALAVGLVGLSSCASAGRTAGSYANPVIPGEIPDPTVIRVGDTYYAAGTSFDFAPEYPIYESKDLVNWTQVGAIFREPPEWCRNDFWAPELFYNNGVFYVYYTAKRRDNRVACIGVAATNDIRQGFTDHGVIIEWGEEAIDAYVFRDDDGKTYITWKAYGLTQGREIEILVSELSEDGLQLVGEPFTLTDHAQGWDGAGDEGQCLIKRNGYYYMLYSVGGCCDNKCDYRVRVSRSRNLKSGWEQLPKPILHGGDLWRCPGHGTLVTTPDDRDFYLYHAYSAVDFEFIGRQGMLDELLWNEQTGWPYFEGSTPSERAVTPFARTRQKRVLVDRFASKKDLDLMEWDVNRPKPAASVIRNGLSITPMKDGVNFLGWRPRTGDYCFETQVTLSENPSGIGIYTHRGKSLALMVDRSELVLCQVLDKKKTILAREAIGDRDSVYLKYEATDGRHCKFYWSEDGKDFSPIKVEGRHQVDGTFLSQWGYSPRVGFLIDRKTGVSSKFRGTCVRYEYDDSGVAGSAPEN